MSKQYNSRIQQKHDISTNWEKAVNFVPLQGEIIIYDDLNKMKIGDGSTNVNDLPFASGEGGVGQAVENGGEIFNDYENNIASGANSHASGTLTKATADNQTVIGIANSNPVLI